MTAFPGPARHVHRAVLALGASALVVALAALAGWSPLALLARAPMDLDDATWVAALALTGLLFVLQQQGFVFHWRGESTKLSLDEIGLFLGLLVLPPAHVVLAVVVSTALVQGYHRRPRVKAVFNVAQYSFAALAAALAATALAAAGVGAPWSALPAPAVFSATTTLLVSLVFSRLDEMPVQRVLSTRFGGFVLVGSALGAALGVVLWALYQLHPLAIVAGLPVFAYLRRFGRLSAWADDELTTHRLIAGVSAEVAGQEDLDLVADRILEACHRLIDCGEASLTLASPDGPARVWRRSFGQTLGYGGVSAEVRGPAGGALGELHAFPKPAQARYGEREHQLLRAVAASAASAAANADALRAAREANRQLAASESRHRSLFENAHVLVHVLDERGCIVDQNRAARQALGVEDETQLGRPFELLLAPGAPTIFARLRESGEAIGVETTLSRPDGSRVPALVDARALDEEPARYVVFSRDMSAMKTLESELRRSMASQHETIKRLENMNRELEEFTLWTTHDMREPLRSIGTIAAFLHEDIASMPPEEARDMARRIAEGAERLKDRVKALHAFSLIVQRDDEFQDVDMQAVVEEVVSGLEAKIREKGATIVLPPRDLPTARAQPHRIHQVFANLVENALKYGRAEGGQVEIGVEEHAGEWRFFVRDDGAGIPPGYHERVFMLFQRGPDAREPGSGAGLAIVKRIAEQHGGRAWVESRPGEGACFFFSLPRAPAPPLAPLAGGARKPF